MKTKTIPFDLEMAKKIQAGEIDGKIKTRDGQNISIVLWAKKDEDGYVILALIDRPETDLIVSYTREGKMQKECETELDLVLEVPDNKPVFNIGDTVSINIRNSSYDADFRARYHLKLATVLFTNKYGAGVKTIISGDENYFSFDELIFVRRNTKEPQFKPFDKVLVRHFDVSLWQPAFFWKFFDELSKTPYYTIDGNKWEQCIPYEGNEHLVGTTNKPKDC